MMKFDNAKYRTVLNLIKKTGEFKGKAVPSKATTGKKWNNRSTSKHRWMHQNTEQIRRNNSI